MYRPSLSSQSSICFTCQSKAVFIRHLLVTWQVTQPLTPGVQCSVEMCTWWRSEDRNNLENSGKAKPNIMYYLLRSFSLQKRKGGENYRPQSIFRCRVDREEKRLSKLRELCKSHTFIIQWVYTLRKVSEVKKRGIWGKGHISRLLWLSALFLVRFLFRVYFWAWFLERKKIDLPVSAVSTYGQLKALWLVYFVENFEI